MFPLSSRLKCWISVRMSPTLKHVVRLLQDFLFVQRPYFIFLSFKPTSSRKFHIRCFGCTQIYVERVSGCPHMECRMCKSEFCYFCGERWNEIHPTICSRTGTKDLRSRLQKFRRSAGLRFRRLGKKLKTTEIVGKRRLLYSFSPSICISSFTCICCRRNVQAAAVY